MRLVDTIVTSSPDAMNHCQNRFVAEMHFLSYIFFSFSFFDIFTVCGTVLS